MKMPRLWRRPAAEVTDPDPANTAPAAVIPAAATVLQVTAYSRSGLPDEEFSAQTATLRRILSYDGDTRSWYGSLSLDHPQRAAEVLTALFEAARVHCSWVQVQVQPIAGNNASEQMP